MLVTCVSRLDVPRHVVEHLARLLAAHRRRIGTPRGSLVRRDLRPHGCGRWLCILRAPSRGRLQLLAGGAARSAAPPAHPARATVSRCS
ncbi:hypothetical protein [Kitasatospora sp. Root107]|uniref:hypothetical protein n=1 Tax=Kitasatospora sp. Root107 TaxID=1736424 RepID=UPI001910F431|nr:hypothetical protein [Kitasatospora sp. Root107]